MVRQALLIAFACSLAVQAAGPPPPVGSVPTKDLSVEDLARQVRRSLAVITTRGRDGKTEGLGSGFVIDRTGLIATNLHVIGEGRGIKVELADGSTHDVISIHATDRANDLAIVRIEAKDLTPLPLGDARLLRDGQSVVALGNPKGLKYSVVEGVISGRRKVEGRSMIQIAIPIEQGNSGGPVVDRRGRVVGITTMKSLVTANLGFAIEVNALEPLLKKPNPVPMSGWLTIGAMDPDEWLVKGGQWRQRAGRIIGEGRGTGIGARGLCLSMRTPPKMPYSLSVQVKLDDEAGAAGLVFHADGGVKHYGFYPSGKQMRFACFEGADVFTWRVLEQTVSPHYRPGEWNTLGVRVEKGRYKCYVNEELVFDITDETFNSGKVGLAKFRDTVAEFRFFRVGKNPPSRGPSLAALSQITKALTGVKGENAIPKTLLDKMPTGNASTLAILREKARELEMQANRLRQLAVKLHQREVLKQLSTVIGKKEASIDLIEGALLIARLDNDEIDVEAYRAEVDRMARRIKTRLPNNADEDRILAALETYLFKEKGFHGSRADYYNRSNSYLSEVIDDREGLPITLSLLYIELAKRLGVTIEGVGLPGHFIVRHVPRKGTAKLIDVFDAGKRLARADAERIVKERAERDLEEDDLKAVTKKQLLIRILHNLLGVARQDRDLDGMLRYVDAILTIDGRSAEERWLRAALRFQARDLAGTRADVEWLLENKPTGIDLERVEQLKRYLDRAER